MSAAYSPAATVIRGNPTTPSGNTAERLVLIALVLQLLGATSLTVYFLTFGGLAAIGASGIAFGPWTVAEAVGVIILAIAAFVFLYVAYAYSYLRIRARDYEGAKTPTLLIGVLALFFGILPGVLFLLGYLKLGYAVQEQRFPPWGNLPA